MKTITLGLFCLLEVNVAAGQDRKPRSLSHKDSIIMNTEVRELTVYDDTVQDSRKAVMSVSEKRSGFRIFLLKNSGRLNYQTLELFRQLDGNRDGYSFSCYPNGMPKSKGSYNNNKKEGRWYHWAQDGKLKWVEIYSIGRLIRRIRF